jgi:hypothetical protein
LGRAEVARAHATNLLADALDRFIYPAAAGLAAFTDDVSVHADIPLESRQVLVLNPSLADLLAQLQDVLADIQDAWASYQLLGSWQINTQGPLAASRLRRNAPADAWAEETVERSIAKAEGRIVAVRGRVLRYVQVLEAQSRAYGERSNWAAVSDHLPLKTALREAARHSGGLANQLKDYARIWGVPIN